MEQDPQKWLNSETNHNSPNDQSQPVIANYGLTVEETAQLFADAGVPRSVTTITRFCRLGDLDCVRVDTERHFKWMISEKSVQKRITQIRQALKFTSRLQPVVNSYDQANSMSQLVVTSHEKLDRETNQPDEEAEYLRERVEELEGELLNARVDNSGKEQFINQLATERKELITQMNDMSFKLGEATARLQQLEAPRPTPHDDPTVRPTETTAREAEVVPTTPPPAPTPEPAPVPEPQPEKPSFLKRLFGK